MKRGEVYWADLGPPAGRRPVLVLTRTSALEVLHRIVVAPITTTIRDIATEVPLGPEVGLADHCVANCDSVATIPKALLDSDPIGEIGPEQSYTLDQALRFALDIRY